ncbi:conserved oligomeric Golgi complex subunit 2 [Diorhabda carinulata]|uniref:conserved oligomeric Golgi complex subunit 2 n=1 Tax=Diorhabda carinulata TaxID=1163345 RepID=UPI0025A287A1|nr:conserved oligomeric Golgi complex subunit 2 [Diorhabda carinulata]
MSLNEVVSWKESFFKDDFNVDISLSKFTLKSDLETLKRDLKSYGIELQQQMTEILKNETEAIVNLAEYLTNLNAKIEHLSLPFFQLREEIMALLKLIKTAEMSYKMMLYGIKNNNTNKNNLNLKLGAISSSVYIDKMLKSSADSFEDIISLEHIVAKYSFQRSYMDELNIITTDMKDIMVNIENQLVNIINKKFLKAVENEDTVTITKCLRMYENLKKQDEAQDIYRIEVVKPYLRKLFNQKGTEKSSQNLDEIYDKVVYFIDTEMDVLHRVLESNGDFKKINFVYNSFWKEFDKQSREGLPYITAPGNPELFQKRYKSTYEILLKIATKCGDKNIVIEDDTFIEHLKRFNLPVYLEIRYQRIAGDFETAIYFESNEFVSPDNEISCYLKPTVALWNAVSQCFHEDIYLDQLADQFVKLSMLTLSRYLKWCETTLQSNFSTNQSTEQFIMNCLIDFSIVEKFMCPAIETPADINNTVYKILDSSVVTLVPKIVKANLKSITNVLNLMKSSLVKMKVEEIYYQLQHVEAIPRLYRRTNRSIPKEASPYMVEAVKPITTFHSAFQNVISHKSTEILNDIILQVTKQYLELVQGVLRSVCKTEESLRRLKSRNVTTEEISPQLDSGSDEMKIREQIKLDVAYFLHKLQPLASTESRQIMDVLKKETH